MVWIYKVLGGAESLGYYEIIQGFHDYEHIA